MKLMSRNRLVGFLVGLNLLLILYINIVPPETFTTIMKFYSGQHQLMNIYDEWPPFSSKTKYSTEWYRANCFKGEFKEDVETIFSTHLNQWSESDIDGCRETYQQFDLLYEVHSRISPRLTFPTPFAERVKSWLRGDPVLLENVHHQNIIHVYHPLTSEHVVYNPVRAQRPMPSSDINLHEWVNKQSEETAKNCDFCNVSLKTAVDDFGRHETPLTIRMSNTFKLERWHTLIVTRHQHHPLNYTLPTFIAFFDDAWKYMLEVEGKDKDYIYPNIEWDTLYQGGASQLHPHIHALLSPDHYYGFLELLRSSGQRYYKAMGKNYFSTLLEIHEALGLTVHYGNSVAFPTLAGKSDMEVMFLGESPGEDFYRLIFYTVQAFHDTYMQLCKGLSGAYPAIGPLRSAQLGRIPAVARLLSRGDCPSPRTDYTSYEIYQVVYRKHDPWQVAEAIRKAIKKHDK